jgi:hypothetical protein
VRTDRLDAGTQGASWLTVFTAAAAGVEGEGRAAAVFVVLV